MIESKETPKPLLGQQRLMQFVVMCITAILISLLSFAFPLYSLAASTGEIYSLYPLGWSGDTSVPWAIGILPLQDYSALGWSIILTTCGAGVLLAVACKQKTATKLSWATLALVVLLPLVGSCVLLATDNFPMPYVVVTNAVAQVTVTAAWGAPLWGLVVVASVAAAGGVLQVSGLPQSAGRDLPPAMNAQPAAHALDDLEMALLERVREQKRVNDTR
jgi:hypothetical protein